MTNKKPKILRLKIDNFSQFSGDMVSESTLFDGFEWNILVQKNNKKDVGFYMECKLPGSDSSWSCRVKATLIVISRKDNGPAFQRMFYHKFCALESDWGFPCFLNFKKLVDPKKNLISKDNVIFEIRFTTLKKQMPKPNAAKVLKIVDFLKSYNNLINMPNAKRGGLVTYLNIYVPDFSSPTLFDRSWQGVKNAEINLKLKNPRENVRVTPQYLVNLREFLIRNDYIQKPGTSNEANFEKLLNSATVDVKISSNDSVRPKIVSKVKKSRKLIAYLVNYLKLKYKTESSAQTLSQNPPDFDFCTRRIWLGANKKTTYKVPYTKAKKIVDLDYEPQHILNLLDFMSENNFIRNLTNKQWKRCLNLLDPEWLKVQIEASKKFAMTRKNLYDPQNSENNEKIENSSDNEESEQNSENESDHDSTDQEPEINSPESDTQNSQPESSEEAESEFDYWGQNSEAEYPESTTRNSQFESSDEDESKNDNCDQHSETEHPGADTQNSQANKSRKEDEPENNSCNQRSNSDTPNSWTERYQEHKSRSDSRYRDSEIVCGSSDTQSSSVKSCEELGVELVDQNLPVQSQNLSPQVENSECSNEISGICKAVNSDENLPLAALINGLVKTESDISEKNGQVYVQDLKSILQKSLQNAAQDFDVHRLPHFIRTVQISSGQFLIVCSDQFSFDWLQKIVDQMIKAEFPRVELSLMTSEMEKKFELTISFSIPSINLKNSNF